MSRQIRGFTVARGEHGTVALVRGGKRVLLTWEEAEALAVALRAEALRALERRHEMTERARRARKAKAAYRALDALEAVVGRRS